MWLPTYRLWVVAAENSRPRYATELDRAVAAVTGAEPDPAWIRRVERRLGRFVWRVATRRGAHLTIDYDERTSLWSVVVMDTLEEHVSGSLSEAVSAASGDDVDAPWIVELRSRILQSLVSPGRDCPAPAEDRHEP
jgi:hypothetical protein